MRALSVTAFSGHNHPAGQIVLPSRRTVAAKVNALVGYRVDAGAQFTSVSFVPTDERLACHSAG
jgi:hypothetical protein